MADRTDSDTTIKDGHRYEEGHNTKKCALQARTQHHRHQQNQEHQAARQEDALSRILGPATNTCDYGGFGRSSPVPATHGATGFVEAVTVGVSALGDRGSRTR